MTSQELKAIYQEMTATAGGKHLLEWLESSADNIRRSAHLKTSPEKVWLEIHKAAVYQEILDEIKLKCDYKAIGRTPTTHRSSD